MIPAPPAPRPPAALGWLLLAPAAFAALACLVVPSVYTAVMSMRSARLLSRRDEPVGLANYVTVIGEPGFWRAVAFSLLVTLVPVLVAVVVAPLLALALDRGGSLVRRGGRVVLSLAVITFSPIAVVAAWTRGLRPDASGLATLVRGVAGEEAALTFPLVVAAMTFGVVCALATLAFLPALRGGTVTPAMFAVAALAVLTLLAVGLQAFTFSSALSRGGSGGTRTLGAYMLFEGLAAGRLGAAAAAATLTGVLLGALGLAAVAVVVLGGMRLHLSPRPAGPGRPVVGVLALVVVVAVGLVLAWPWITALFGGEETLPVTLGTYVRTWLPALAGALVSVAVAYAAALGIGGLRPLGRNSEWLLLPFAPWALAGVGPFSLATWTYIRDFGLMDTIVALVPPMLISVPALVVLTLLCRGLAERAQAGFLRGVVLPSLPMAGILTGGLTLVNAQDGLWPLMVSQRPDNAPATMLLSQSLNSYRNTTVDVGITTPLPVMLLALAAVVAAQLLYLDRLAITMGRSA
ncbi:hypothetical protein [Nonomuraea endophytica]|uniref:ABC-type sugar transport system permease subunit n=1 Tax=Nonomuraea endophytica TaxID=714136 RepID=A0A7W8EFS3_9ACTN|nr:hypothetical protein [Nonomuraea endophytica]MBB5077723.1 ABC-type sugar transport system permease subunit [Nonomuraea endophytica]